ncbi:IS3 family transposase [Marinihelvus fidelis]|uniref:IS3 family transposase n=1 Tax=Marinihelvus fidelis TaxID=2613842 RepID=A0A5N0TDT0_9GAMM|nr:IS3 family transposase [Marinihelvus fidelis]KAA9131996.1 IS3 family transposase [Marinihelvus fidelis]
MKFAFIEENRKTSNIRHLCHLLGVSRSGYYAWRARPVSAHRRHDERLKAVIGELHQGFRRCYGAPRLHRALVQRGWRCSRRRINRLMRELGIKASSTGLYQWRPGRQALYSSTSNRLAELDTPRRPGHQWAGDFTYVRTRQGWLYHAVVLDLYSRQVVGWSFGRKRGTELTTSALNMALARAHPVPGCLFHSDQGIEYAAHEYRDLLRSAGLVRSMSRKGKLLDNAMVESYFHSMKSECVRRRTFNDRIEATAKIVAYTEFYNRERLHSSLGYRTPQEYAKLCA